MIHIKPIKYSLCYYCLTNHRLQAITTERKKLIPYIQNINNQINHYYNLKDKIGALSPLPLLPKNIHNILYGLYDSDEETISNLKSNIKDNYKKNIFSNNGKRCPYCGILRQESSELDHFLPRAVFPEFSVLPINLIHVCSNCNSTGNKGNLVKDKSNNKRMFLNPYFDSLIAKFSFIKCTITTDDIHLSTKFFINPRLKKINCNTYIIANNHFKQLKLNERYIGLVEDDLMYKFRQKFVKLDTKRKVRHFKSNICLNDFLEFIQTKINECNKKNINDWELIFWRQLKKEKVWLNSLPNKTIEFVNDDED